MPEIGWSGPRKARFVVVMKGDRYARKKKRSRRSRAFVRWSDGYKLGS
jgi:hypothetical protein